MGFPLNGRFGKSLVIPTESEHFDCEAGSKPSKMPAECALLRLSQGLQFELSFSNCLHVDEKRKIGYICKRELGIKTSPQALMCASSSETQCGSEWFGRADENNYVYSISRPFSNLSWYEAQRLCREKGGELPVIESATEANWIRDRVQSISNSPSTPGRIFVNLHECAYNRDGWGWSTGASLDTSVLRWDIEEPDNNCGNQDNCASLAWKDNRFEPVLSDQFCHLHYPTITLLCKRSRASCLPSTCRMTSTNSLSTRNVHNHNNTKTNKRTKTSVYIRRKLQLT